jgi:hypothetical protein
MSWGLQPETDSNLVDVYVNYLRRKTAIAGETQLIHTVRGIGYRLGQPASVVSSAPDKGRASRELPQFTPSPSQSVANAAEAVVVQQTPLRGLINSVAHDLAQPLTSVRCFLEVIAMRNGAIPVQASDLKNIEQQADRAIGLAKTIASLVRDVSMPSGPWISLDNLLNDVFNDFVVLTNSGLLTVDRQGESSIQVTSSPVLRQLLVVFVGKLVGKNTRALTLTVSAQAQAGRCTLSLRWKAAEQPGAVQDARTVLAKDVAHIQEIVSSIGAEMTLAEGAPEISLKLPCAPPSASSKQRVQ